MPKKTSKSKSQPQPQTGKKSGELSEKQLDQAAGGVVYRDRFTTPQG
jgi:hypothetical protein